MANVLADLLVRFGADSADLRKSIKTVQSDVAAFRKSVETVGDIVKGAFAFEIVTEAARKLSELVTAGAEAAEQMGKMAEVAGLSVEQMSRLAHAARMGDLSTDQLSKGVLKLSEALTKGAAGSKEQVAIFEAMGYGASDLQSMLGDTHGALLSIADKIAGYADGAEKAALVSAIFGDRLARELLPFLNKGADGIKELEAQSDRLGRTLSANVVEGANSFNDSIKVMSGGSNVLGAVLASELAPAMASLAAQMEAAAASGKGLKSVAEEIADVLKTLATAGIITGAVIEASIGGPFKRARQEVLAYKDTLAAVMRGDALGAVQGLLGTKGALGAPLAGSVEDDVAAAVARIQALWAKASPKNAAGWSAPNFLAAPENFVTTGKPRAPIIPSVDTGAAKPDKFKLWWEEFKAQVDAAQKAIDTANKNWGDEFAAQVNAASKAIEEADKNWWSEFNAQVAETSTRLEEAGRVFEATRTPVEQYRLEIERLSKLQLDPETFARATEQATQRLAQSYEGYIAPTVQAGVQGFMEMARQAQAFGDLVESVFNSMLQTALSVMSRMLTEWIATQVAMAAVSAGTGIPLSSSGLLEMTGSQLPILGGKRALGGPVSAGDTYLVGERGPELFTPNVSGAIVPNEALRGGGRTTVHLTVNTLDAKSFDAWLSQPANEMALAKRIGRIQYKRGG